MAGDFRIDAIDALIGLKLVPKISTKCGQSRPLWPLLAPAVNPLRRMPLHSCRHERVAEGFAALLQCLLSVLGTTAESDEGQ